MREARTPSSSPLFHLLTAALLLGLAAPAAAVDGVVEINQASAEAGVTLGDAPGFPVTLMLRGSYRLTGELNVPADTSGIVIQNDSVHIDLNGFAIVGGGGVSGDGIATVTGAPRDCRVSNGTVRNMARDGLRLGEHALVEDVMALDNGGDGIEAGESGTVRRSTSTGNGGVGILITGANGVVVDSQASANVGTGIQVWELGVVERSAASGNDGDGIVTRSGSRVSQSRASSNLGNGIHVSDGIVSESTADHNNQAGIFMFTGLITRSSARGNQGNGLEGTLGASIMESSSRQNRGDGIVARVGPVVGNSVYSNEGYALRLDSTTGYAGNSMHDNNGFGSQVSGGQSIGTNICNGSTNCP